VTVFEAINPGLRTAERTSVAHLRWRSIFPKAAEPVGKVTNVITFRADDTDATDDQIDRTPSLNSLLHDNRQMTLERCGCYQDQTARPSSLDLSATVPSPKFTLVPGQYVRLHVHDDRSNKKTGDLVTVSPPILQAAENSASSAPNPVD
jgi:hypothetical protein